MRDAEDLETMMPEFSGFPAFPSAFGCRRSAYGRHEGACVLLQGMLSHPGRFFPERRCEGAGNSGRRCGFSNPARTTATALWRGISPMGQRLHSSVFGVAASVPKFARNRSGKITGRLHTCPHWSITHKAGGGNAVFSLPDVTHIMCRSPQGRVSAGTPTRVLSD